MCSLTALDVPSSASRHLLHRLECLQDVSTSVHHPHPSIYDVSNGFTAWLRHAWRGCDDKSKAVFFKLWSSLVSFSYLPFTDMNYPRWWFAVPTICEMISSKTPIFRWAFAFHIDNQSFSWCYYHDGLRITTAESARHSSIFRATPSELFFSSYLFLLRIQ